MFLFQNPISIIDSMTDPLYRYMLDHCQRQGGGWRWRDSKLVQSFLRQRALALVYHCAGRSERFMQLGEDAQKEGNGLIADINFEQEDIGFLADVAVRFPFVTGGFDRQQDAARFISLVVTDPAFPFLLTRNFDIAVIDAGGELFFHARVCDRARNEMAKRIQKQPRISREIMGIVIDEDRENQHFRNVLSEGLPIVKRHLLNRHDDRANNVIEDTVWELQSLICQKRDGDFRDYFRWVEQSTDLKYFPTTRLPSRAKNLRKQQRREDERFQSLDAPQGEEDSPLFEITPDNSVRSPDELSIQMGMPLTHSQRERVREAFRKVKGANPETGVKIVEHMKMNGIVFKHGERKEMATELQLAQSTIGCYLGTKKKRGFINLIANELVEILIRKQYLRQSCRTQFGLNVMNGTNGCHVCGNVIQ